MKIKFCGAAREVTGSAHLIVLDNGFKILLDCGLYQGHSEPMKNFNDSWLFDPTEINVMLLSHAHIDHTGRIPKLVKDGFRGNIITTHATRSLSAIMLLDSATIQERDAEWEQKQIEKKQKIHLKEAIEPLYTADDVRQAMNLFIGINYNKWFRINDFCEVYFSDAGHILGSASVTLRITEGGQTRVVGFTGDVGRPNRPILRDPQPMPSGITHLICESTYGDRLHEGAPQEFTHFSDIIRETCVEKKGRVIIPAFSVGRTQEIVYMLDKLVTAGKIQNVPVYIDSPLAIEATDVFVSHPECFDEELNEYLRHDDNPFGFKNLKYIRDTAQSKALNDPSVSGIIIASSGMANAGRVKHHIFNNIENPNTTILIVGYASPETPAGQLRDGKKEIRLFGENKKVACRVEVMDSFSAHADYQEISDFIENQRSTNEKIFLVHGDYARQQIFADYLHKHGYPSVCIPELGEEVDI